ncbi:MAG: hypothetical protein WC421_05415 [Elusimicrobiales bacterium]
MSQAVYIGIDRGGTWVRFRGLDARLKTVFSERRPSPLIKRFPGLITEALDSFNVPRSASCVIATTRAWTYRWKRGFLRSALKGRLAHVEVLPDMEASLRAALGGRPGIAVLAGTGSVVFGTDGKRFVKTGGLGPELGDEGSAYHAAKVYKIIKTGRMPPFRRENVAAVASGAKSVLAKAGAGDRAALAAVMLGAVKLGLQAQAAARGLKLKPPVAVTYDGSMMKNDFFRAAVFGMIGCPLRVYGPQDTALWCARQAHELWK